MRLAHLYNIAIVASGLVFAAADGDTRFAPDTTGLQYDDLVRISSNFDGVVLIAARVQGGFNASPMESF